jgi:hypothetical protein
MLKHALHIHSIALERKALAVMYTYKAHILHIYIYIYIHIQTCIFHTQRTQMAARHTRHHTRICKSSNTKTYVPHTYIHTHTCILRTHSNEQRTWQHGTRDHSIAQRYFWHGLRRLPPKRPFLPVERFPTSLWSRFCKSFTYICIYMHTYTYFYIDMYVYAYICTYIHTYKHTFTHM